ncbi:hypothetical protein MON38_20815 [Hymenobacter sp. DH14]|uniref:Lipoprotein n=1 Tax=Hymenobacter cyanobacteriorum TaxID=2926463 RepID=A0A9X1VKK6_9BACT|nr:hypothetical protein [Hymenobacter cyanobacteriorum]MCI1189872.1 hypothetical protein [Hymenobacter cyanobacteriorum]
MPLSLHRLFAPATLLLLTSGLLTSCSSPSSTSPPAAAAPETAAPAPSAFPFGGKVDSLNGIAGHTFGEPLSAFSQMRLVPSAPGDLTKVYAYEGTTGWFGKHHAQVRTLYYFLDGKFCQFRAIGDGAVLRPETTYLFGPSQQESKYRLFWEGGRARAAYIEKPQGFGWEGTLDVLSKPLEAALAAQTSARLKAENAQ